MKRFLILVFFFFSLLFPVDSVYAVFSWTQVNQDGFGLQAPFTSEDFFDWEEFSGCLYAGIEGTNLTEAATIFRSCDGTSWTRVNEFGFGDPTNNDHIDSLKAFKGYLYASTGQVNDTFSGTQIWRSSNGTNWTQVNTSGFGTGQNENFKDLAIFGDKLCGGTLNVTSGMAIWCSDNGTNWTKYSPDGFGSVNNSRTEDLVVIGNRLYVSSRNTVTGAEVWYTSNLINWTQLGTAGMGSGSSVSRIGMEEFKNTLYIFAKPGSNALILLRLTDTTTLSTLHTFSDTTLRAPTNHGTAVRGEYLYFASNFVPVKVLRSEDGTNWEQVNDAGFGDSNNEYAALLSFGDYLYAGTYNQTNGQEVWRTYLPLPVPTDGPVKDLDCPEDFKHCIHGGPKLSKLSFVISTHLQGPGLTGKIILSQNTHKHDLFVTVTSMKTEQFSDLNFIQQFGLSAQLVPPRIPYPWEQGKNIVSEMLYFNGVSAYHGGRIEKTDNPFTIQLSYDPTRLSGISPSRVKITYFDKEKKRWRDLLRPHVLDTTNYTVSSTTNIFTLYALTYNRGELINL